MQRFVFSSNYKPGKNEIKPSAFLPQPSHPNELSLYRSIGLTQDELWLVGDQFVGNFMSPPRQVKASAELNVGTISTIRNEVLGKYLKVVAQPNPHPNHSDVENVSTQSPGDLMIAEKLLANLKRPPLKRP